MNSFFVESRRPKRIGPSPLNAHCQLCSNLTHGRPAFTFRQAQVSAASGCKSCSLLTQAVKALEGQWRPQFDSEEAALEGIQFNLMSYSEACPIGFRVLLYKRTSPKLPKWTVTSSENIAFPWGGKIQKARIIPEYSGSRAAFNVIGDWLAECQQKHSRCASVVGSETTQPRSLRPKRLIDISAVSSSSKLRLVEYGNGEQRPPYIALSYCWGNMSQLLTTGQTYQQRLEGFDFQELPRTHMDAIEICRQLSIGYIWIDSLCIIQGDEEDWVHEVSHMEEVYGNAELVIAASTASNSRGGIFSNRLPSRCVNVEMGGDRHQIFINEEMTHEIWAPRRHYFETIQPDHTMPLLRRGWAFQERLLAKRIVHYTPRELIWECRTSSDCECTGIHWENNDPNERWMRSDPPKLQFNTALLGSMDLGAKDQAWRQLVSLYSGHDFTRPEDRLPALSSLARQFHSQSPDLGTYLAGMWSSTLRDSLFWWESDRRRSGNEFSSSNPKKQHCPSWSWASQGGAIDLHANRADEIRAIESKCTPATADPYGAVSEGYVLVEGQLGELDDKEKAYIWKGLALASEKGAEPDGQSLYALKFSFSDWNIWHAMILKDSSSVLGAYERVTIDTVMDKVFEGVEKTIIRIV